MCAYSGTSHNRLSEIQTAFLQRTNNVPPIVFAIEIIHFQTSQRRTTSYFRTTDRKCAPKGQIAVQNSLQEWTEIEASDGKCEISIKISTDSYSAAPRKYIRSFLLLIFVHLVCPHEVADSASYRPHPTLQLCSLITEG